MKVIVSLLLIVSFSMAQDDLTKGKDALNKKAYDEALTYFQKYLTGNSRSGEANYYVGEAYRLKGDLPNAQSALERSLDFDDYEPAMVSLLRVYGKQSMWKEASKLFKLTEKKFKGSALAPLAYAQTYLDVDSLDNARLYFSKAKELDPTNVESYLGLYEVYSRQNIISMAADFLRKATEIKPNDPLIWYKLATTILKDRPLDAPKIQEIITTLKRTIALDSTNEKAVFDAANTMFRTKAYWREAAEFFKKYVELKTDNPEAWEKYALSMYNAKIYKDAIPVLEKAIAMNPKSTELIPMLAYSYYLDQSYDQALKIYNSYQIDSLSNDEVYRMGFSYFKIKDTVNAIKYLEKTIARDKEHTEAIGTLGAIFWNQKNYTKTLKCFNQYLEHSSKLAEVKIVNALYFAGYSCYVLGQYDSAKVFYKRLIAARPYVVAYRQDLGNVFLSQDSISIAKEYFKSIVSIVDSTIRTDSSKFADMRSSLIKAYFSLAQVSYNNEKNIKAAIEYLLKAVSVERNKKEESIHMYLAQMYAIQSGDKELLADEARSVKELACKEYKLVLSINPKNVKAKLEFANTNCGK